MLILITNDDGFDAAGLQIMKRIASSVSQDVWVVAPANDVSGCGRSISCDWPVFMKKESSCEFRVSGSTGVCVSVAMQSGVLPRKPDLVLSGVNCGANVGSDVMYSGTVGGVLEAASMGITSIAFSQYYRDKSSPINWDAVERYGVYVLKELLESIECNGTALNVNFPHISNVKGMKVVEQGFHYDPIRIVKISDNESDDRCSSTTSMYTIGHSRVFDGTGSVAALKEGFITVTPIKLDLTYQEIIGSFRRLNKNL